MKQFFKTLHHVCIVVHDLDKTVDYYEQLGVGPWFDYPKAGPYVEFDVPNRAASDAMRYKCVDLDNVQIQICQPSELDSPQRRFLDQHGEGVYHLGFEVADRDAAEAAARALGIGVTARGARADGSGFAYFDTRAQAGVVLEVRKSA
ncbi:catechol 2,3-dioxygenase-like lactoylglutathione lyase family enzyme [Variovorax boronicumulans]|uniref:Catechol 2,3-dioxygenase-like lactoylglutathione lyase family enzyme n=1 Tax=Variovorax boronicumulans TaxID=436515 RepID=A0AAW8DT71_9BURK|nr:VOC family protein [Variovorax boronicumulans]MDP9877496.1 catechol 2,3-dioxygenase-like lactoylglutathione lyase family enzyme [Variovorax boronicumulans]MDP9920910.1 catechol 2,3-dioxygenase-like lactoylglutathione lyase family enzyme [Variovorax boronicumulans]MDP9922781.1 catechol 2,3-dioxygenase-like lactoylglutathione lyase family enzyme [Variovorax boronicumulans]